MSFSLVGKLGLDTSDYEKALARSDVTYQKFGAKMEGFSKKQEKFLFKSLVGAFGVGAIEHTIFSQLEEAQKIFNGSAKAGVTAEKYQEMEWAAKETGRDMGELLAMTGKLPADVQLAVDAFRQLGSVIPTAQIREMAAAQADIEETAAGINRGKSWLAIGTAWTGRQLANVGTVTSAAWHGWGRPGDPANTELASNEFAEVGAQWVYGTHKGESQEKYLTRELIAKRAARAGWKKETQEMVERILEQGSHKMKERLGRSAQIGSIKAEIDDLLAGAAKKKGPERDKLLRQVELRKAELAVVEATPEKSESESFPEPAGRALQAFDPLNRIGGFAQGADTTVVDRVDRIAKATEETARNTRPQNPMEGSF